MDETLLKKSVIDVINANDRGTHTVPAEKLYSHQWLWDSCFVAIGLRHMNIKRAQHEVLRLLHGQWANGMVPHMIFAKGDQHRRDRELWRSYVSPFAPDHLYTSGITQPPMLAEAIVRIGEKMNLADRRNWYQTVYPGLLHYHQWMYSDRDPHNESLVLSLHPYETGFDNTPPWIVSMREHSMPFWITALEKLKLESVVTLLRRDTRYIPPGQRISTIEALAFFSALRRLRRKAYNTERILSRSLFAIEDLAVNCIAIRANQHLQDIAKTIRRKLPDELTQDIARSHDALDELWDASSGQYYSRNFVTHKLILEPTVATLLPLYSGAITKERAKQLVDLLHSKQHFAAKYPAPSVPLNSTYFDPLRYWQGPSWININWLVADGLTRYGYSKEALMLRQKSLELVAAHGPYEYFSPLDGTPAGARGFSWTAALILDWLS